MKQGRAEIGRLGEETACKFLVKQGFSIVERNYRKKWGEIDIIAQKGTGLRFIEVKTVSRVLSGVIHETLDSYRAEDNVHAWKTQRLARTIQTYLLEKDIEREWQFDVITVFLDTEHGLARVSHMENLVL